MLVFSHIVKHIIEVKNIFLYIFCALFFPCNKKDEKHPNPNSIRIRILYQLFKIDIERI